ncbi:EscU/YscU/HrcU family type III secretion system export apparatus switch protein [Bacillus songklensis]|uniref:EscU/YscU/HrcU family type III secretion system export apparatus switch protein n=2 Tax=Bacillus songklensis TaxID=1069116 RepID=A0ABV8BB03_9BACI
MNHTSYPHKQKSKVVLRQYGESGIQPLHQTAGTLMSKLVKEAEKQQVPIQEDEALLESMTNIDLGEHVPPQLYAVIAEMLTFIQEIENDETA